MNRHKLKRDMDTLRQAILLNRQDIAFLNLSPVERTEMRDNLKSCITEMNVLIGQLDALEQATPAHNGHAQA